MDVRGVLAIKGAVLFLVTGAVARAATYLVLPISQYGNDSIGFDERLILALPVYFVLFRSWVGVLVGTAIAYFAARGASASSLVLICIAVPLASELLLNVGLLPSWYELGSEGARVGVAYLSAPLIGGVALALWTMREVRGVGGSALVQDP